MNSIPEKYGVARGMNPIVHQVQVIQSPFEKLLQIYSVRSRSPTKNIVFRTLPDISTSFFTLGSQSANRRRNSLLSEITSLFSPGLKGRSCIDVSEQQNTTLYTSPPRTGYPMT